MLPRPALTMRAPFKDSARFWARVDLRDMTVCWPWKGPLARGYGRAKMLGSNQQQAHRIAHWLITGESPEVVMHTCDNRACCNPAHLKSGTTATNIADKIAKGRHPRHESHGMAKLNWAKVDAIRASDETNNALAAQYGVAPQLIAMVRNEQIWVR